MSGAEVPGDGWSAVGVEQPPAGPPAASSRAPTRTFMPGPYRRVWARILQAVRWAPRKASDGGSWAVKNAWVWHPEG